IDLRFDDAQLEIPLAVSLTELTLNKLVVDLDTSKPSQAAPFNIGLELPGLADRFSFEGSLTPSLSQPALTLKAHGYGLKTQAIQPILDGLGIQSQWRQGTMVLDLEAGAE